MFKNIYRKKFPNPHAIVPPCSVKIITGQAVHSCFWLQEKTWEPVHCFSFTDLGFPMWNSVQQQHHHGRNRTVVEGRDRIIDHLCPPLTLFFIVAQNRHGWKAIFICFSAAFIGHQPEYKGEKKGRGVCQMIFSVGPRMFSFSAFSAPCRRIEVWWHVSWKDIFIIFKFRRKWIIWSITTTTFWPAVRVHWV